MQPTIGNVVIIDGQVGVIYSAYGTAYAGVYLTGESFIYFKGDVNPLLLDLNLNDYINRQISRFGKVKVERK